MLQLIVPPRGNAARVADHNVRGQVFGFVPQPVREPRPESGKAIEPEPRIGLKRRRGVIRRFGEHRMDEGELVGDRAQMGKQLRDPQSALATLLEFPVGLAQEPHLPEKNVGAHVADERLAMQPFELRLVVERIDLAEAPAEKDVNGPFGFGKVMRQQGRSGIGKGRGGRRGGDFRVVCEKRQERRSPETAGGPREKSSAGEEIGIHFANPRRRCSL